MRGQVHIQAQAEHDLKISSGRKWLQFICEATLSSSHFIQLRSSNFTVLLQTNARLSTMYILWETEEAVAIVKLSGLV